MGTPLGLTAMPPGTIERLEGSEQQPSFDDQPMDEAGGDRERGQGWPEEG
jgi:hypothetical protein